MSNAQNVKNDRPERESTSIRISSQLLDLVKAEAKRQRRSVSAQLEVMIEREVAK